VLSFVRVMKIISKYTSVMAMKMCIYILVWFKKVSRLMFL